jgi:hypothetical protein
MTTGIVSDGPLRFLSSDSFQARCRELRVQVRLEFSARLAGAGFFRRLILRFQMHQAFQRAVADITPSSQSLWLAGSSIANKRNVTSD